MDRLGSGDRVPDPPAEQLAAGELVVPSPTDAPRPRDCDHHGFVRAVRNRDAPPFQVQEHVVCSRCGQSFGIHVARP